VAGPNAAATIRICLRLVEAVEAALRIIAALDADLTRIRAELTAFGRRHPGPRELAREYGLGALLATAVWEELGDTRRFSASRHAVRHAGLDISVYDSDGKHKGRPTLTRQGPPALRWALYEGAVHAHKQTSPDHAYYTRLARRIGSGRAVSGWWAAGAQTYLGARTCVASGHKRIDGVPCRRGGVVRPLDLLKVVQLAAGEQCQFRSWPHRPVGSSVAGWFADTVTIATGG
jgi:transposase